MGSVGGQNGKYLNPTGLICIEKREKSKKVKVGRGKMGNFLCLGGGGKLGKSWVWIFKFFLVFSVFQVFQVFWVIEPKDSLKNKSFRPVKFDFYGQNWEEIVLNFSYLHGLLGLLGLLSLMGLLGP